MSHRSNLQRAVLVIFALGAAGGAYYIFYQKAPHATAPVSSHAVSSSGSGISGLIGEGLSRANKWWNGTSASPAAPHTQKRPPSSADTSKTSDQITKRPAASAKQEPSQGKGLSATLSALENEQEPPPPVVDSHTAPSAKVLKQREKTLLERRNLQEKKNKAIQRARMQEMKKRSKLLFASDIAHAKKGLGFSPQGYRLWENANGFLIANPQNHRFELVLETGTCAGALGQDTPELKQLFQARALDPATEIITLYQANQEGQSAKAPLACRVRLTVKKGQVRQASEHNCTYWHGAECAFSIPLKGLRALPDLK